MSRQEPSRHLTAPLAPRVCASAGRICVRRALPALSPFAGFSRRKVENMSLYNLDRFRFERKGKGAEQECPARPAEAPGAAGGDEEEGADDSRRPDTPASDLTERTGESGALHAA